MNPLDMMKFKGMFEKFVTRHPMLQKYATKIKKTYHKCVIIRGMKERQSEGYS